MQLVQDAAAEDVVVVVVVKLKCGFAYLLTYLLLNDWGPLLRAIAGKAHLKLLESVGVGAQLLKWELVFGKEATLTRFTIGLKVLMATAAQDKGLKATAQRIERIVTAAI